MSNEIIETNIRPENIADSAINVRLLVIPGRADLMGHEIILGLDVLKELKVKFETVNRAMVATINDTEIARDVKMLQNSLFSMDCRKPTKFDTLAADYSDIFAETAKTFIKTSPMTIPISVDFSTKAKLRPHSIEDTLEIERQVNQMIKNDIIEPSMSTFSANVHLVPKKSGQKRLVVDFRFLNSITIKDYYPLPQISEMFMALRDARHFAALDCTEGFLQIPVLPEHRHRTAFVTSIGHYHYKRVPFGFTNSPAKFQRTMNDIFREGLFTKCVIYIDDILVFGKTEDQLYENLLWVYEKCRQSNVKLKLSKCKVNEPAVEFLGFEITYNQICPVKGKYDAIGIEKPTNRKHIRAILGAMNHYARFISRYADKTAPIRRMTRKGVPIEWNDNLTKLVNDLKSELANATPVAIPDSQSPKFINILVSPISIEITCFDAENNLIGRAGATLSQAERCYTMVELQLTAIVLAYNKFHLFLRGNVTFKSTCKALQNALKMTHRTDRVTRLMLQLPPDANFDIQIVPGPTPTEDILINDDDIDDIFYTDGACLKNGTKNCKAAWAYLAINNAELFASGLVDHDRLSNQIAEIFAVIRACEAAIKNKMQNIVIATDSRYVIGAIDRWIDVWKQNNWRDNKRKPVVNQDLLKQLAKLMDQVTIKAIHVKGHSTDANNIKVDQMAKDILVETVQLGATVAQQPTINQRDDPEIEMIITNLELDASLNDRYELVNGELYYLDHELPVNCRKRLFVPTSSRNLLLRIAHDDPLYGGHMGIKKTRGKLIGYYWPNMTRDIERFIKSCTVCQSHKTPRKPRYGVLHPIPISDIFDRIHIDIIGPMHESSKQNRYIMTAIDGFSRYAYARAAPEVKTIDLINFMTEEIFTKHGCPSYLVSDNGTQFTSVEFKTYIDTLGIKHNKTVEYHPQANGLDERLNGTLVKILKNYIQPDQSDWDLKLPWAVMLYNTTNHSTTMTSPYTTLYGVAPKTPLRSLQTDSVDGIANSTEPAFDRIRKFVKESILSAQQQQKKQYDKHRKEQDFNMLDSVYVRNHYTPRELSKKLQPKWDGPFFVYKIIKVDEEPMSVVLVNEATGKFRRAAFQDLKHAEHRDDTNEETIDEIIEQNLPGIVFQQAARQACPNALQPPVFQIGHDVTASSCTTEPTMSRQTHLSDTMQDTPIVDQSNNTITSSSKNTQSIIIERSSVWDELIPRKSCEANRIVGNPNRVARLINGSETTSNNVVAYSNNDSESKKQSGQTAHSNVNTDITNNQCRHHAAEPIEDCRHHTVHLPSNSLSHYHTTLRGQTAANQSQNNTISLTFNSSQTTANSGSVETANDAAQASHREPTNTNSMHSNATGQPVIQSTPLVPTDSPIDENTANNTVDVSNIPNERPMSIVSIDNQTNQIETDTNSEQSSDNRPKRNPKIPDRYQA